MKTIEINDEDYEFLMNLKSELNAQDCRCTASPYYYTIRIKKRIIVPEGCGTEFLYKDDIELEEKEEIIEYLLDNGETLSEEKLNKLDVGRLFCRMMDYHDFKLGEYDYEYVYENVFLTEKSCEHHIPIKKHNLGEEPVSYVDHAYRNPEMEKLLNILKSIK